MRFNGGVVGAPNEANTSFASGVWGWDEQFVLRRNLSFPNRNFGYYLDQVDYSAFENRLRGTSNLSAVFVKPDGLSVYVTDTGTSTIVYQYDLAVAWDLRSHYQSKSFNADDVIPSPLTSLYIKSDGTKLYLLNSSSDTIYQYTLSTPWDISTASYDSVALNVSAQEATPTGITFKSDGTKLYIIGSSSDNVREYNLPTPWVLTGGTLIGSYSATGLSAPSDIRFSVDGTDMYISDSSTTTFSIHQYSISTAWSANSASFVQTLRVPVLTPTLSGLHFKEDGSQLFLADGSSEDFIFSLNLSNSWNVASVVYTTPILNVSNEETNPNGLAFSVDGANVYIVGSGSDTVFQYSLNTPWSISSATYNGLKFSVGAQDSAPSDLAFKPDGSKMYILGGTGDDINQYTLSESWNIASASFDSIVFSVTTQDTAPQGIAFRPDGTQMYVVGSSGDNVYQYSLSSAWNIASASYDSVFFYVGGQESVPQGVTFRDNGAKMFITGTSGDDVNEYLLSESWNVASAAFSGVIFNPPVTPDLSTPSALEFSNDGLSLYLLDSTRDAIYQFSLSEANNISRATFLSRAPSINILAQDSAPSDIALHPEGTRLYMLVSSTNRSVYQYDMSTPFDLRTAIYSNVSFSFSSQETSAQSLAFKPDGTKMYIVGSSQDRVFQYTLSSPWDIDSASYDSVNFLVGSQDSNPSGLTFKPDGTKMYMVGGTLDNVHQYTLSSAWNISTASYDSVIFNVAPQDLSPSGIKFKPDGRLMYISGTTNDRVYQYTLSTPWDISTASNNMLKVFSGRSLAHGISGFDFSSKGDKLYLAGTDNDIIQEIPIL